MKVIMNMPFVYSNEFSESYFKGEIPEIGDDVAVPMGRWIGKQIVKYFNS